MSRLYTADSVQRLIREERPYR